MLDGYIELEEFSSNFEAEIAKNLLLDGGVEALIGKDDCGGMMPNLQFVQGVRLYVLPRDVDISRSLLKRMMDGKQEEVEADGETWNCSKCGTKLEHQFTDCWKCGTPRVV